MYIQILQSAATVLHRHLYVIQDYVLFWILYASNENGTSVKLLESQNIFYFIHL